ncbi:sensor histidine kinase [Geodermatophilus sp. URMC 64]
MLSESVARPADPPRAADQPPSAGRGPPARGEQEQVEALTRTSLRWLLYVAVISRVVLTVPAVVLTRGLLGDRGDGVLVLALGVVLVDGFLVLLALRRPAVLVRPWLFGADVALALAATLGATLLIAPGTFLLPGRDALTGYGWGTVVLWTAIRGWRTGAVLVAGTAGLQVAMAALNAARVDAAGIANLLQRCGLALLALLVTAGIVAFAERSARLTVRAGLRAGRLAERAAALRALHDTALAELEAVVLTTRRAGRPAAERLAAVTRRAAELSSAAHGPRDADLVPALGLLAGEFSARGIDVQVVGRAPADAVAPPAVDALVGAVREALNNVVKHAGVRSAVVRVAWSSRGVEVEVADEGRGFVPARADAGFGIRNSIRARLHDAGGDAEVTSAPGRGTRVRLVVPTGDAGDLPEAPTLGWFPLVPLAARLLSLGYIASAVGRVVPGLAVVLGVLAVGHVLLLVRLRSGRGLGSPVLFSADLAVTAVCYLWVAAVEPAGAIVRPDGDGIWLYVLATVVLWVSARGPLVGAAVVLGACALQVAGLVVNGVAADAVNWTLVGLHVGQLAVSAGLTWLVLGSMRKGLALARAESLRAGRELERVQELARLHREVVETWRAIARPPRDLDVDGRLEWIRWTASATAGELRAALRQDGAGPPPTFAGRLDAAARSVGPLGLSVELVVTELSADPPREVADALVTATRLSLADVVARGGEGAVVVRASGSAGRAEVCLRDPVPRPECCAEAAAVLRSVGGRAGVRQLGARGTRTELSWSAP